MILYAFRMFWTRTVDCFRDPIRRLHLVFRCVEGYVGGAAAVGLVLYQLGVTPRGVWHWAAVATVPLAGVVAEYLVYEYAIEPWARGRTARGLPSVSGPYWERGPRAGEQFLDSQGVYTIGLGHTLAAVDPTLIAALLARRTTGRVADIRIAQEEADQLFAVDVAFAKTELRRVLPWTNDCDDARRAVLLTMISAIRLADTTLRPFLAAVEQSHWPEAVAQMKTLSTWRQGVGARATRLEAQMLTGTWT